MKKVRYATGALAALGTMPALALVTPPAAAAVTQAPARTGKTVSLTAAAAAPLRRQVGLLPRWNLQCTNQVQQGQWLHRTCIRHS